MIDKKAFKSKILEPLPGAALGGFLGYKDKGKKDKRNTRQKVVAGLLGATGGGFLSKQLGRGIAKSKAGRKTRRVFGFNPSSSGTSSMGANGKRPGQSYEEVINHYRRQAKQSGATKGNSNIYGAFADGKGRVLRNLERDLNNVFENKYKGKATKQVEDSFFGIKDPEVPKGEAKKVYEDAWDDIASAFDDAKRKASTSGRSKSSRGGAGRASSGYRSSKGSFNNLGFTVKGDKVYRSDGSKVKTKKEVKKVYRNKVKKTHPDRGGSAEEFDKVKKEWDAIKNTPGWEKLAYILKQAKIKKNEETGKFELWNSDETKVLGTHPTYEKALAQERAIWASKRASMEKKAMDTEKYRRQAREAKDEKELKRILRKYKKDAEIEQNRVPKNYVKGGLTGAGVLAAIDFGGRKNLGGILGKQRKYLYPAAAAFGAAMWPEKKAAVMESDYNPIGELMGALSSKDKTVEELSSENMNEKLRDALIDSGVLIKRNDKEEQENAFYAGGRNIHLLGEIDKEHKPSIIAHELGHKDKKHLTKSMLSSLVPAAAGAALAKKYVGGRGSTALGALAGSVLASPLTAYIASEKHEREADEYGAKLTSDKAMADALRKIVGDSYDKRIKKQKKQLDNTHKWNLIGQWANKAQIENLEEEKKKQFNRPDSKIGRAWSRATHAITTNHPPVWRRAEYLNQQPNPNK